MKRTKINTLKTAGSLCFSQGLYSRYNLFRKRSNLPALIFLRLFYPAAIKKSVINQLRSSQSFFKFLLYFRSYFYTLSDKAYLHTEYFHKYNKPGTSYKKIALSLKNLSHIRYTPPLNTGLCQNIFVRREHTSENLVQKSYYNKTMALNLFSAPDSPADIAGRMYLLPHSYGFPHRAGRRGDAEINRRKDKNPFIKSAYYDTLKHIHGNRSGYFQQIVQNTFNSFGHMILLKTFSSETKKHASENNTFTALYSSGRFHKHMFANYISYSDRKQMETEKHEASGIDFTISHAMTNAGPAGCITENNFITNQQLHFNDRYVQRQELYEIRKLVDKTKESLKETGRNALTRDSMNQMLKQFLDINSISDRIYSTIERRIRAERERRGI